MADVITITKYIDKLNMIVKNMPEGKNYSVSYCNELMKLITKAANPDSGLDLSELEFEYWMDISDSMKGSCLMALLSVIHDRIISVANKDLDKSKSYRLWVRKTFGEEASDVYGYL